MFKDLKRVIGTAGFFLAINANSFECPVEYTPPVNNVVERVSGYIFRANPSVWGPFLNEFVEFGGERNKREFPRKDNLLSYEVAILPETRVEIKRPDYKSPNRLAGDGKDQQVTFNMIYR